MPVITGLFLTIVNSVLVKKLLRKTYGSGKKHGKRFLRKKLLRAEDSRGKAYIHIDEIPSITADLGKATYLHVVVDGAKVKFGECKGTQTSPLPPFYSDLAYQNPPLRGGTYSSYYKEYQTGKDEDLETPVAEDIAKKHAHLDAMGESAVA